jgi:3-oxoacyl-[acyl-carrier-protein] synthase II
MDRVQVVVSGAGAISPLGARGEEILQALAEGKRGFSPLSGSPFDPDRTGVPWAGLVSFAPEDHFGDKNYRVIDRTGQLVLIAAGAALAAAGLDPAAIAEREVGLVLGTLFGSVNTIASFDRRGVEAGPKYVKPLDFANSVINAAAGQAAIWHDLRGINSTVAGGGSGGIQALAQAFDLIRGGRATVLLAGGAEELSLEALLGFGRAGLLAPAAAEMAPRPEPFGAGRNGAALAEGAALLLLETAESARQRGARPLGALCGHGAAFDPSQFRQEESAAEAIARAIGLALEDAGWSTDEVDLLLVSASGLPRLDRCEAMALAHVFGERLASVPFLAPKRVLGETLGAGGALAALVALAALRRGEVPAQPGLELDPQLPAFRSPDRPARLEGRRALVVGLGLDGAAAALALESWAGEENS